jgi:hypothetical protein
LNIEYIGVELAWIGKHEGWLGEAQGARRKAQEEKPEVRKPGEKLFTVDEVARIFKVDKRTVFNWMAYDEDPEQAIIPPEAWFKLQHSGHIRIMEWIVLKLLNPTH